MTANAFSENHRYVLSLADHLVEEYLNIVSAEGLYNIPKPNAKLG
jgi:hypothetical protein